MRIAVFVPVQNGFAQAVIDGAKAAATKEGASVDQVFGANGDLTTQINQIHDAVASGKYEALLVYPLAPQVTPAIKDALGAGLKVGVVETSLNAENPLLASTIPDLTVAATEPLQNRVDGLVEMTVEACKGTTPCNVGYIRGIQQNPTDVAIFNGFQKGLAATPSIAVVGNAQGMYQVEPSRAAAQDLLSAHPDIDVFVANADIMIEGAALAASAAGRTDLKLIGAGASDKGCAQVKAGAWFGTTNSVPQDVGAAGTRAVVAAARGGAPLPDPIVNPLKLSGLSNSSTQNNATQCPSQWKI